MILEVFKNLLSYHTLNRNNVTLELKCVGSVSTDGGSLRRAPRSWGWNGSSRTPSPPGRWAPSTGPPCVLSRPLSGRTDLAPAAMRQHRVNTSESTICAYILRKQMLTIESSLYCKYFSNTIFGYSFQGGN